MDVVVLKGGLSAEAEVSRASAAEIAAALEAKGHRAIQLELDSRAPEKLSTLRPDVVFPALHGPPGEDGTVQGMLEILEVPYVGSGVRGSALAMDKSVAKKLFVEAGLPVLPELKFNAGSDLDQAVSEIRNTFGESVVIKPLSQGSAIGVTPLPDGGDLAAALETSLSLGPCLVEPFFAGKEITAGVLEIAGEADLITHPVIEISTADGEWYDYTNRYAAGKSEHLIPAGISEPCRKEIARIAADAHRVLGLRDLSRADFIVSETEEIILLEVNTLPGMTPTSLYPDGARHLGYDFPDLIDLFVRQAASRP